MARVAEDDTRLSNKLVAFRQIGGHIQVLDFIDWIRINIAAVLGTPYLDIVIRTKKIIIISYMVASFITII